MSSITSKSHEIYVRDAETAKTILTSDDFAVDHPFRATRHLFGPNVLDTEGAAHRERKRSWLHQFTPEKVSSSSFRSVIDDAVQDGFDLAEEEGDLLLAAIYIPNKVLLSLAEEDDQDPLAHYDALRPVTSYLETNIKNSATATARAYLRSMASGNTRSALFRDLDRDRHDCELALFLFAAAETTIIAIKTLLLHWVKNPDALPHGANDADMDTFISSLLRADPPLGLATRYCRRTVEVNGHSFEKGDIVHVSITDVNGSCPISGHGKAMDITFGAGVHACPGRLLARTELVAVARHLSQMDASLFYIEGSINTPRPMNFRDIPEVRIARHS